jgi:hypothetical protein
VLRAERRLAVLAELTEIGLEMARGLRAAAAAPADGDAGAVPGRAKHPAELFASLSRAIRLTLSLEAKTDQEWRDLKAGIVKARENTQAGPPRDRIMTRLHIENLVAEAIDAEAETRDEACDLYEACEQRLFEDEAYYHFTERPYRETVERLCKDLGLTFDESRWEGDGWRRDLPRVRPRYSVFNQPSRVALLNYDDEDDDEPETPVPSRPNGHALE